MKYFGIFCFLLLPLASQSQIITTIAGVVSTSCSGVGSYGGDGGPATAAHLNGPWGLAPDNKGNLLICDLWNLRIRKIDRYGLITTVAGGGSVYEDYGSNGEGLPALELGLEDPESVAVDRYNNFYFTEDGVVSNILKVDTAGINTTFVSYEGWDGYAGDGGPATAALIGGYPEGLTFDSSGNFYISDYANNVIRKVDNAGTISTVAGNGHGAGIYMGGAFSGDGGPATAAELFYPTGVAIDKYQNIYVADAGNQRVRKVNRAGIISTVAGNGIAGYSGDGMPATNTELNFGNGSGAIAVDKEGRLLIADYGNNRIRMVDTAGMIYTIAGNGVAGYAGDGGAPTAAELCSPSGIALDDSGNIYISDYGNNLIREITYCHHMPAPIAGADTLCAGAITMMADTSAGGSWASSNSLIASVTGAGTVAGIRPGADTIFYRVSPVCAVAKKITVITANAGVITANESGSICAGFRFTVADSVAGGAWSVSNGHVSLSGDTVTATSAGRDTLYYTVVNLCGTAVAEDSVLVLPPLPPITGNLIICAGDTTVLSDSSGGGMWTGGDIHATVAADFRDEAIVAGLSGGTAAVTYSMDLGCFTTAAVIVNTAPPAGIISGPDSVCRNAAVTFYDSVAGGTWSIAPPGPDGIDSVSGRVTASAAENLTVYYKMPQNAFGCRSLATHQLSVLAASDFSVTGSIIPVKCYGGEGSIFTNITGPAGIYAYRWSTGDTSASLSGVGAGNYAVYVLQQATQCADTGYVALTQPDSLLVAIAVEKESCGRGNGSIRIIAAGGTEPYRYLWQGNTIATGADSINDLRSGVYVVAVSDSNGCSKQLSATVGDTTCRQIIVHDCITPNGDGINDVWVIEGIENYPMAEVQVFDKRGDRVFIKTGYGNDWNGADLPDGSYVYLVTLNDRNWAGGDNVFKGMLLVKR